jgi:hypothetical protein
MRVPQVRRNASSAAVPESIERVDFTIDAKAQWQKPCHQCPILRNGVIASPLVISPLKNGSIPTHEIPLNADELTAKS